MHEIIVIAGPTAVGKSSCAIELAKKIDAEIISVDCYQCYKYMDIGTAKATKEQLSAVKHYMVDEFEPTQSLSVFEYAKQCREIIDERIKHNNLILVGGSGLYLDSIVFNNYSFDTDSTDESYRKHLQNLLLDKGKIYLYDMLNEIDPQYAKSTHYNNTKRVIRALEYHHATGNKMSEQQSEKVLHYENTRYFVLYLDREILYPRINQRVDEMIELGLVNEVEELYQKYKGSADQAFKAIGYSEIIDYIENNITINSAINLIKQHTRNYAKRQYTWFRRNTIANWINLTGNENAKEIAGMIYGEIYV